MSTNVHSIQKRTSTTQRILVLGGTGASGIRILGLLRNRHPDWQLVSGSRQPLPVHPLPGIEQVAIDVGAVISASNIIKQYDLVIIALGPMDTMLASVHRLCLDAGVNCVDINDCLSAADEILQLDAAAREKQVVILTGMGLAPGLSTLLLSKLCHENASASGHYNIRFYAGAAYGGGKSSPYAILDSFGAELTVLRQGKRQQVPMVWQDADSQFTFPGQLKPAPLIAYSSPEVAMLQHGVGIQVQQLDARYHIQYLTPGAAKIMGKLARYGSMRQRFATMFYNSGQKMKQKKDADPDTSLWVYPDANPERGLLIHGGISSYDMTAAMACAITEAHIAGALAVTGGVFGVNHLQSSAIKALEQALASYGILIKPAATLNYATNPLWFGWSEIRQDDVTQLRHYGQCWYDVQYHPRMQPLQMQFLTQSKIWGQLRQHKKGLGFMAFVAKVMWRWRQDNRQLATFRQQHSAHASHWQKITKDISMFTSGYRTAREILGKESAYQLYREMFLHTGCMEMRWLWPSPEVVKQSPSAEGMLVKYYTAFVQRCAELGLVRINQGNNIQIEYCAYADMFRSLGCPELENLVREMEAEALEYLVRSSKISLDWKNFDQGRAVVEFRPLDLNGKVSPHAQAG